MQHTWHSLVVTDPTTTQALTGLAIGEQTRTQRFLEAMVVCTYGGKKIGIITVLKHAL